jgi:Patatin-like phospholipase
MSALTRLTSFIGLLDSTIRTLDFRVSRTVGGPLERWGISRHTWVTIALPAAMTFFLVNGPALRIGAPRLILAIALALLAAPCFGLALRISQRRGWSIAVDYIIQVTILAVIAAAVWVTSSPEATQQSGGPYRQLYIPLTAIVAVGGLAAAALAATLFRSRGARDTVSHRLTVVELFVTRPLTQPPSWGMLGVAFVGVLTSALGRLLLPPSFLVLLVPRGWVRGVFAFVLLLNLIALAFASIDRRFDAAWHIPNRVFFRGWARLLSWGVIALGAAWVLDIQYVSTVLDGARNRTIIGIVIGAYVLTWWHDYWSSSLVAIRVLDVLGGRGTADDAIIEYPIRDDHVSTEVSATGRIIQAHGAGRLIVIGPLRGRPGSGFHLYEPSDLLEQLADGLPPHHPGRADIDWMQWRLRAHFMTVSVVLAALAAGGAWLLHGYPQVPLLAAQLASPDALDPAHVLFAPEGCRADEAVLALSASGGGTRAALYTAAVLERLQHLRQLHRVRLVSGVSGGGAALAYFAGHHAALLAAAPGSRAWTDFFDRRKEPYIEDVIDGAAEWRMVSNERLGTLLAESFAAHWRLPGDGTLRSVTDIGIILNTALAGRFLREPTDPPNVTLAQLEQESGRTGLSDVAGGRLLFTNLALPQQVGAPGLFTTATGSAVETRDARLPIVVVSDLGVRLADAAAANANFPPVFANAAVDVDRTHRYWVTDGGAIDNRGLETMLLALRHASSRIPADCATTPAVHVIEIEASSFSDGYRQDRGVGSVIAAGSAFASQLDSELLQDVRTLIEARGGTVQFHYLPMPAVLRRAGSVGTHWMLQKRVTVCLDPSCTSWPPWRDRRRTLTGDEVLAILRALGGQPLPDDASAAARETFCVALREATSRVATSIASEVSAMVTPDPKDRAQCEAPTPRRSR